MSDLRCNRCHRPMKGTTAYDGACECGGLIESIPARTDDFDEDGKESEGEVESAIGEAP